MKQHTSLVFYQIMQFWNLFAAWVLHIFMEKKVTERKKNTSFSHRYRENTRKIRQSRIKYIKHYTYDPTTRRCMTKLSNCVGKCSKFKILLTIKLRNNNAFKWVHTSTGVSNSIGLLFAFLFILKFYLILFLFATIRQHVTFCTLLLRATHKTLFFWRFATFKGGNCTSYPKISMFCALS